ncbi:MAG: S8 family serine peptidase [Ahniella sp.]|nr:S8 family serine peptidase [Ahniella sp.]
MRSSLKLAFLALTPLAASIAAASGADHKVLIPKGEGVPAGYKKLVDYGSFALYAGSEAPTGSAMNKLLANADMLLFDRQNFDTQNEALRPPVGFALSTPQASGLHLVQFVGPMKDEWLAEIRRMGGVPVHYIANNGYLLWVDANTRAQLGALVGQNDFLQYSQPLPSFLKLGPTLADAFARNVAGDTRYPITVQRYRTGGQAHNARFAAIGLKSETSWAPVLAFENARFSASLDQIRQIVEMPDVFWVGEFLPRELFDEVQSQIVRGHFSAGQAGPASEGYKGWLESLNFPTTANSYAIVDVTDDGIGNRTTSTGDATLHDQGNIGNASRVIYNTACTAANGTVGGHGHINTNIIGGFDIRDNATVPGARFPGNYQRGLGINPWTRLGGTRIFSPNFDQSACGGTDTGVILRVQDSGATISNNSWGCSGCAGSYDDGSQAYDAGVRDADTTEAGNQEIVFVFSAGNSGSGAGTIGTPGNGKNMITVGASENKRETDENGNWTDGCSIGPTGADNAMDVISFSSRGPAPGNRKKPEVIAPGTHITGTQPNPTLGDATCDAARPVGNLTYNASSGTSHSSPAVAGVASLVDYWITNGRGSITFDGGSPSKPSPALQKAWMMAHPTYLTGVGANDTLPSNTQGYGMPNLESMFNNEPKYVLNQTRVLGATGEQFTLVGSVANGSRPLRVALAYTDKPGAIGTSPQVNNLNLEVIVDGTTYRGNVFTGQFSTAGGTADAANNYEAVFLPAGTGSAIEIRVIGANIADDGVPGNADTTDQDFALVCDNCVQDPTFTLSPDPLTYSICTTTTPSITNNVTVGQILGFTTPVALSLTGEPAGTTESFVPPTVTPPGSSVLTLGNLTGATAGTYAMTLTGTAGAEVKNRAIALNVFSANPTAAALTAPADAAGNVPLRPTFTWTASTQAASYVIEVDDSADFSSIVYTSTVTGTSHTPGTDLPSNTPLNWRVRALNTCGSVNSPVSTFTTVALPGDCSIGTVAQVHYTTGFETAPSDWTPDPTSVGGNWAITSARVHGGANAFLAQDLATVSDQRLVSPAIALPAGQAGLILSYYSHQILEDRTGGCYDGGLLEVSTDGGTVWTQVPGAAMLTDPYNGPFDTGFGAPLPGAQAWCEDPPVANAPVWTRSVVDLNTYAGQSVRFRFRVATDSSVGRVPHGFYLDSVLVQGCTAAVPNGIFAHGFE